ncbi:MAG: DUF5050 domain-containing protein [Melioribacteraceae bacterium]|nr:DUF5050 domain-containing protein [Melioribacteraceae bacterium]
MLRTIFVLGICICTFTACLKQVEQKPINSTQKIEKKSITNIIAGETVSLTAKGDGFFNTPVFSNNGEKVFFANQNYSEVWSCDADGKNIKLVAEGKRIAQSFVLSGDDRILYAIEKNKRGKRGEDLLLRFDLSSGKKSVLYKSAKGLVNLELTDNELIFLEDDKIQSYDIVLSKLNVTLVSEKSVYQINGTVIKVFKENGVEVIKPFEDKNILWVEKFHSCSNVLFSVAGDKTYLADENCSIIKPLGDIRNPKISWDDTMVAYYLDKDDGMKITGSDIFVKEIESGKEFMITDSKDVQETNPDWAKDGESLVYATDEGIIKLVKLIFN